MNSKTRILVLVGIGLAYSLVGGALALTVFYEPGRRDVPLPAIHVAGVPIRYDRPLHGQLTRIGRAYLKGEVTLTDGEFRRSVSRRDLGAYVDYGALERRIRVIVADRADLDAFMRESSKGGIREVRLQLPVRLNPKDARQMILDVKYEYDRKPSAARLDMETRRVVPHQDGRMLVMDDTLHGIQKALCEGKSEVPISAVVKKPEFTTQVLSDMQIGTVLGWFETPYCLMKRCWDRNHNLELGGRILDGTIVGPGEVFDFNDALGERNEARGFKPAPTIEAGVLVPTPGGGTCQTASTLYAAAFFAGLDILDRRPHSRPSGYILLGLDATVTYGKINLVMRNPYDFPVVIHYAVSDGKMRVEILGKQRPRMVHFVRRVTQKIPYTEETVEMPDWPAGVRIIEQIGIDGYRVRRYRIQWEGTRAWREVTEDVYPATPQVVKIGTNKAMSAKDFEPPPGDLHSPYEADKRIKYYLDANGTYQKIIANW